MTTDYKGYSAIVYSCKEWEKSVESFNETNKYEEQDKGHTVGAKFLFDAFSQNCGTFKDFKKNIIKSQESVMLTVYNEQNSDIYTSLNIFSNETVSEEAKSQEEIFKDLEVEEEVQ